MTWQPGNQKITVHILPNISRNKGNQKLKFGESIEYNMKNIILEKSCIEYGEKTSPTLFYKKSKQHISTSKVYGFIQLVLLYVQVKSCQNILKLRWRSVASTSYKAI